MMVYMDATTETQGEINGEAPVGPAGDDELRDRGDTDEELDVASPLPEPTPEESEATERRQALDDALMSDEARYARWQSRRPPVSHLMPGVVYPPGTSGPLPIFDVGTRVVVEQRTAELDARPDPLCPDRTVRHPWLRTVVGEVRSIDDDTGHVVVAPEDQDHRWVRESHFSMFDAENTVFFLAPRRGDPFDVTAVRTAEREAARAAAATRGAGRGRGRPKGSGNRPKDVIQAERDALRRLREEKRLRRDARRGRLAVR